jgi:DNA/RNA-binding protein KIN17
MLVVGEHAGKHIADFSGQFQGEFVALLSRRFGTKRVRANQVYQEYISDKQHLHMNSTRWVTLTEFVKYLGRSGIARVDETEKGWFIAWIDNSPKALAKAEASLKKERATTSDEQRERQLIAEQIERAATEAEPASSSTTPPAEEGLKRDENTEKVVLSFSAKPLPSLSLPAGGLKLNPLKPKTNPLKRPNVLKRPPAPIPHSTEENPNDKNRSTTAERLVVGEQEGKRRRMDRESVF